MLHPFVVSILAFLACLVFLLLLLFFVVLMRFLAGDKAVQVYCKGNCTFICSPDDGILCLTNTKSLTDFSTSTPTNLPSIYPTSIPTYSPSNIPTPSPTIPTFLPSSIPTQSPTTAIYSVKLSMSSQFSDFSKIYIDLNLRKTNEESENVDILIDPFDTNSSDCTSIFTQVVVGKMIIYNW